MPFEQKSGDDGACWGAKEEGTGGEEGGGYAALHSKEGEGRGEEKEERRKMTAHRLPSFFFVLEPWSTRCSSQPWTPDEREEASKTLSLAAPKKEKEKRIGREKEDETRRR